MTDDGRTTTGERTPNAHDNDFKNKTKQKQKTNTTDARTVYENTHARERGTRGGRRRVLDPFKPPSASKKKMKKICTRARARSGPACSARARVRKPLYNPNACLYKIHVCLYSDIRRVYYLYSDIRTDAFFFASLSLARVFFLFSRPLGIGIRMAMSSNVTIQRAFGSPRSRAL